VDDFQTVTTYNHQTYVDACAGTLPDWSVQTSLAGSTMYERAVRGGGKLNLSNWQFDNPFIAGLRVTNAFVGWAGGVFACVGEPSIGRSNIVFTHDDICIYGGFEFNRFQLTLQSTPSGANGGQFGPDLQPGIAGVDDDGNGSTDDDPNCNKGVDGQWGVAGVDDDANGKTDDPGDTHASFGCHGDDDPVASGLPSPEYLGWGPDGCPGDCGVDDDGNGLTDISDVPGVTNAPFSPGTQGFDDDHDGTTDELGEFQPDQNELGHPGTDDSDDTNGDLYLHAIGFRANVPAASTIGLSTQMDSGPTQFSLQDVTSFQINQLDAADEIGVNFYQADVRYNYAVCATGSLYGAQLWIGNDVANPVETLGPKVDTNHLNKTIDREAGFQDWVLGNALYTPLQNSAYTTNSTFGDLFQILEGDILPIVAQDRDKDGDVDGVDFSVFASCFNKAGNPPRTLGCTAADGSAFDQDGDGDVDGVDFAKFASCFNKAGNPPRKTGCIPDLANPANVFVPPNDLCVNATAIGDGQTLDNLHANATTDWTPGDGNCAADALVGPDLWYEYTPSCSGTAVTVTASTANTNTTTFPTGAISNDTALAIFSACPPSLGTLLICVDNDTTANHETTSTIIDTGTTPTVIIAVIAEDPGFDDRGQVALDTSCTP
jgi:hypothetical protein